MIGLISFLPPSLQLTKLFLRLLAYLRLLLIEDLPYGYPSIIITLKALLLGNASNLGKLAPLLGSSLISLPIIELRL